MAEFASPHWIDPDSAAEAIASGTGKGISIAVIDSGIEIGHPDLVGLSLRDDITVEERDGEVVVLDSDGSDNFGHGTAVAGVIRQVAPEAEIGSIRVLNTFNSSKTIILREGARQAIDRGYDILNCSFGCGVLQQVLDYKTWVDQAYLAGRHVVAACNNRDMEKVEWPGYFTSVIGVNMARAFNPMDIYFRPGNLIEFATQGVGIEVPWKGGRRSLQTGSSFATPRMAGILARLLSIYPDLPPLVAKAILRRLARPFQKEVAAQNTLYYD